MTVEKDEPHADRSLGEQEPEKMGLTHPLCVIPWEPPQGTHPSEMGWQLARRKLVFFHI